jgi:hypothetical protein
MSDFLTTYRLSRGRLDETIWDLNADQLNWRLHTDALTIGEMVLHVAGVEVAFASQLTGIELDESLLKLRRAATEGSLNDKPFPYSTGEITPDLVHQALTTSRAIVEPILANPTEEVLDKQVQSALGPVIDGRGTLARFAFHPAYHQGQAYLIRHCPGFPK